MEPEQHQLIRQREAAKLKKANIQSNTIGVHSISSSTGLHIVEAHLHPELQPPKSEMAQNLQQAPSNGMSSGLGSFCMGRPDQRKLSTPKFNKQETDG